MFINLSNHKSESWSLKQKKTAEQWGEIRDYPFPSVSAQDDEDEIQLLAEKIVHEVINLHPNIVMCQGEFTLTYAIVSRLKAQGLRVVAACSERVVTERTVDGKYEKQSEFEFVKFREY